jgi:VIT1/CCC1 family predicted Fe2+/Mn2+ transporter
MIIRDSIRTGVSFGMTSAVITTLGLMVGLNAGTNSRTAVLGGILTIAIADAFSDALGIHICEESENAHSPKEIWQSTVVTFMAKFLFALIFVFPVLLFDLTIAVIVNVCLGLTIIVASSYYLARQQDAKPWKVIVEHLFIAFVVILITQYVGDFIAAICG